MYDNRVYIIISTVELTLVNFDEILEDSYGTVRLSNDTTKSLLKWDLETNPSFYNKLNTIEGPYTHNQILELLSTTEWYKETL